MAKLLFVFVAVCLCQAFAKPSGGTEDHLKELGKQITEFGNTLHAEMTKVIDLPETAKQTEEINKKLEHGLSEVVTAMTKVVKTMGDEVKAHSPEAEKHFKEMKEKIEKEVEKIKKEHPKEAEEGKKLQKKMEDLYSDVTTNSKKIIDDLEKNTEGLRTDFAKGFEEFASFLKTNVETMGKTLKEELDKHQKAH